MNEATEEWAKSLGVEKIYNDPEKIFSDPDIDAVFICSSTDSHAEFMIKAANAGKHIFCEKPIHTDPVKIREALAAVEKAGVKLLTLSNYSAMLEAAVATNYIKDSDLATLKEWRKSPSTWAPNKPIE